MSKVGVISRGTPQAKSFRKTMDEYTTKNNLPIEWKYVTDKTYEEELKEGEIKVVIISPEVMISEAKIKANLELKSIPYVVIKPSAFGLRQTEKFMPDVMKYI